MTKRNIPWSHRMFEVLNLLYTHVFFLYKPVYFLYKSVSERERIRMLKADVKLGMTVLDIGANVGFYTILFSKLVGNHGKVHAFEPDSLNCKHLRYNTKYLKNIIINETAVAEKTGSLRLYHSDHLNVDHLTYDTGENRRFSEVKATTIDDYFTSCEEVDVIKLDIQGYDYFALEGMSKTVRRSPKVLLIAELWPYGLRKAGVEISEYFQIIKEFGFDIKNVDSQKMAETSKRVDDKFFHTDFYAIKES